MCKYCAEENTDKNLGEAHVSFETYFQTRKGLDYRIRELENYLDEVLKSEDGRIVRAKAILKEFNVGLDRREWVDRALAALEGE